MRLGAPLSTIRIVGPQVQNLRSRAAFINPMVGQPTLSASSLLLLLIPFHSTCPHAPRQFLLIWSFWVFPSFYLYINKSPKSMRRNSQNLKGHYYSCSCHDQNATYMISYKSGLSVALQKIEIQFFIYYLYSEIYSHLNYFYEKCNKENSLTEILFWI